MTTAEGKDRRRSARQTHPSAANSTKIKSKSSDGIQISHSTSTEDMDEVESDSTALKREGSPVIWFRPTPTPATHTQFYGWQHPAELKYRTPHDWSDTQIIHHLIAHSFDIPQRKSKGTPFFEVTSISGLKTVLPSGYRIPLMFIARFQWLSLKLVLSAEDRESEWNEYKFGILHVSRLCKRLLHVAQEALGGLDAEGAKNKLKGIDRKWRSQTFDRALARYKLKWFISEPEQLQEFWDTYKDEEYKKDPLKYDWRRWALKGHRGFSLTEDEIENGITAQQLMNGLKVKDDKWFWDERSSSIVGGADAWDLRQVAQLSAKSVTPPPSPRTESPTDQSSVPIAPFHTTTKSPLHPSKTTFASNDSISQAKVSAPSPDAPCTLGKRPGTPLEKAGGAKTQKIVVNSVSKKASASSAPVPTSNATTATKDPSPPPFSPALPSKAASKRVKRELSPTSTEAKRSEAHGKPQKLVLDDNATPIPREEFLVLRPTQVPGPTTSETSGSKKVTAPVAEPATKLPHPPSTVPVPHQRVISAAPAANPHLGLNGNKKAVPETNGSSRLPHGKPNTAPTPVAIEVELDSAAQPIPGTISMLGLNLRSFGGTTPTPTPTPAIAAATPTTATATGNSGKPSAPSSSSPIVTKNLPSTGTTTNGNTNTTGSQETVTRAVESLFNGFTESMKRFSTELKSSKEEGLRDMKQTLQTVVREEIRNGVNRALENSGSSSNELNPGAAADLEAMVKRAIKVAVSTELAGLAVMVEKKVGNAVLPLRAELVKILEEVKGSRKREEALVASVKVLRDEIQRLKEAGLNSNVSAPLTSSSSTLPIGANGAPTSLSGHPLAHLLDEQVSVMQVDDDEEEAFLYGPPLAEKENSSSLSVVTGVPLSAPERSRSGTPMSMSSDILLIEPEPTEQKYRPSPTLAEHEVQPHLPPTPSSPFNTDEIEDVKPVLIDGRAFLPSADGEQPTPLSAFVPRRFRKSGAGM